MSTAFSKEEKAAMRAVVAEAKAAQVGADLEAACLAAIAEMSGTDQELAETLHRLVKDNTDLGAKTWYGMPAYANADGKVVVFFQSAAKFKVRYATIGFQPDAHLDEGNLWPTSFAVERLTDADQKQLVELLKKAVS
ncbi:CbbQ/NirQ/NorQ C-terminal domain-containing protein [Cryobacterium sp. N22]|uniref:CbbQ/NirQ/NorQ domain-containing protein n=1 Tax=Cryobacterium sp. N22 TaxID=2048290 RepID=UPI0018EA567E|nr:CbbQ/NirQ/NorQ C-terminal domain-containing protein [Cryobacterium sp. N22]